MNPTLRRGNSRTGTALRMALFSGRLLPLLFIATLCARAADLETAQQDLRRGKYAEVIAAAAGSAKEVSANPGWVLVLGEALRAVGRYDAARDAVAEGLRRFPLDLRLNVLAFEAQRDAGADEAAKRQLEEIERLATTRAWAYRSPEDRVALGKVALLFGADPKRVLEAFFDPVRKEHPDLRESYLASGDLALAKSDFALAARSFNSAAKKFPEDADVWFGVARAYAPSEPQPMLAALEKVIELNRNHVGAWLLRADYLIDAEEYEDAANDIDAALALNPNHPSAHAYRAVIATLRSDAAGEKTARAAALKFWKTNPQVPHLIGRKLSQKYRFAEGAAQQREALKFDPDFLPAKAQLANDLLRLGGHDDEAWKLAEEVQKADPYDVVAFNLTTLRDAIAHFKTLNSEHFIVKMDPKEADIYGADALALLEKAHATLTKKYGLTLREKTIVEIFPDQKDFAIRTFGLPGGSGYLGVCFGRVITANSPASRPNSPNSWEAVLWHEFCHVVTLTLTKNKMPRWLSEGISVFEERQARGSWGEQMKPRYRAMILGQDLTPVSQLSGAFLRPKSAAHLGFAYYESSLAVDWLTQRWGIDKMKRLLADLARGSEINTALAAHFAPIEQLDAEFAKHAKDLASKVGPKLDWTPPKREVFAGDEAIRKFITGNPNNFAALLEESRQLVSEKKWAAAKVPLQKLIELYPEQHETDGPYALLARVQRELGETDAERATLTKLAELSADATDAFARLMELAAEKKEWPQVLDYSARYIAVDPLRPAPHRSEAEAREALGEKPKAIAAYRTLLQLAPPDAPEMRFRLARLLHATHDPAAKREVLLALEEAPRFRAAHELLLEIAGKPSDPAGVKSSR